MPRAVTIINAFLGVVIIALLAGITTEHLSALLGKTMLKNGGSAIVPVAAAARTENLSFYAPILTAGLFGKATQGQLTPITTTGTMAQAAPATAPSELLLLGTVVGSFRETFALVRHVKKQEERVFRLGDMVFDAGRLAEVRKESAFIVINNRKVELLTPMTPPMASPPGQASAPAPASMAVASTGAGSYLIDQRALNAALDNPAQAMSDARLLPSQKDGKVEGFRASEVKPNGVFGLIGIKNGDVLLRLNDFPMDSPDKALQSFISLKGQSRLKLDIIRDGQPQTFNYDIR
ncbi:MAG: type II secretion system protein GspC [Desulfuromonadaceae bacterium]|nr:type II secretion system protein GspC [Desulfuromonadaceae bacterium]MDD2847142.1 type II secretion system protein GspC [Desulfuromonadaceae bacterium]MDD4130086.1 type II secretion system protein GspC [Desulfuromonadaceae bacterium]